MSWTNLYSRPDLQKRAVVLKIRDNYYYYKNSSNSSLDAIAFADAAYNGGIGGLDRERRICKLSSGCDPSKWFGHVENHCLKSKRILYSNRNACDINRHHVKDVIYTRSPKYVKFFNM